MAFWTLPPLRQRVQTYARCRLPPRRTRTRWRFGSKRRFVATIEWLRLCPNEGFFPQTAQTLDMAAQCSRRLPAHLLCLERRPHGLVEGAGDAVRRLALLRQDPLDERGRLLVARALGHPSQLLVAADLQMLEGAREPGELPRRVRMGLEERAPIQRAEPERSVLHGRRIAAERVQACLDRLRVVACLVEVLRVDARERRAVGELRPALEERDRLLLDRVRVGEVLPQLLGRVVAADLAERRLHR